MSSRWVRTFDDIQPKVYLHILDEEILFYIDAPWACNCKDCVRIEPELLTRSALHAKTTSSPPGRPQDTGEQLHLEDCPNIN